MRRSGCHPASSFQHELGHLRFVFYVLLVAAGIILLWGAISPRSQWWAFNGWAFRNPDANEPSDAAYTVLRVASIALLLLVILLGYKACSWQAEDQEQSSTAIGPVGHLDARAAE